MANNATIPNETKPNVNTPEREPRTKNKRNYKKILKRTGAVVATAAVIFTLAMAPGAVNAHKEAINADSLVEFYLDGQNGVTIGTKPSESEEETSSYNNPTITSDSDQKICSGDQLLNSLDQRSLTYVCIDGTYYTRNGEQLAAVTYKCTRVEEQKEKTINVNGKTLTLAPNGSYNEENGKYYDSETEYITRVVLALDDNDYYMSQKPAGYSEVSIEDVQVFDTVQLDGDIIADVADNKLGSTESNIADIRVGAHQEDNSFYGKVTSLIRK